MFFSAIEYQKARTHRIIVTKFQNGFSSGSGFFIGRTHFLTCFHVVSGTDLKILRNYPTFTNIRAVDEHSRCQLFVEQEIRCIEIELETNVRLPATLKSFDEHYDIALLQLADHPHKIKENKLDYFRTLEYGMHFSYFGFPMCHGYQPDKVPLAFQEGTLSAFPETVVAGEKYPHLQINSIALGGVSGAPLFLRGKKNIVGIVNGNMNIGSDVVYIHDLIRNAPVPTPFRIPLSIAYATELRLLKEKTKIFDHT